MLKLSARAVGAAFFGTVSGLLAGLCLGFGAWWSAGIFLFAALACLMWSGRAAMLINETLEKFGVPLDGVLPSPGPPYPVSSIPLRPSKRPRSGFPEGKRKKGCVSERPKGARPSKPKGQGGERLN